MKTLELPKCYAELLKAIHNTGLTDHQRRVLAPLVDKICEDITRRKHTMVLVQDALGQLRLEMKYVMFDLEATRRERDERKPI